MKPNAADGKPKAKAKGGTKKDPLKDMHNYFNYMKNNKCSIASANDKQLAAQALDTLKELDMSGKEQFLQKFKETKKAKDFGWVKNFKSELSLDKSHKKVTAAKLMTRWVGSLSSIKFASGLFGCSGNLVFLLNICVAL